MYACSSSWHGGELTHYTSQVGLVNHDPVPWVVALILRFTIWWHLWAAMSFPQPNTHVPFNVYSHVTLPVVFTHLLWMHWWISMAEVITSINPPQGSFDGRAFGDCTTTTLLQHHLSFTFWGGGLAWGGAGTPVPCMMDAYTQVNTNLWCDEKSVSVEDAWPSALVHHFIRGDVCHNLMHHLPCILFPPILDLPLSLKSICLH